MVTVEMHDCVLIGAGKRENNMPLWLNEVISQSLLLHFIDIMEFIAEFNVLITLLRNFINKTRERESEREKIWLIELVKNEY